MFSEKSRQKTPWEGVADLTATQSHFLYIIAVGCLFIYLPMHLAH